MASVYKRGRWVDGNGKVCAKGTAGATWKKSKTWTVQVCIDGRRKLLKGYTDKSASEQMGANYERARARGEQGLTDPYKAHRHRPLVEHVGDWIGELRQLGRDDVYIRLCDARMARLVDECGWMTLADISAATFLSWRETATVEVGHARKPASNIHSMSAKTQNHYLTTLRTFCLWAIRRNRMADHPLADVPAVNTAGQLRRQRRALHEDEINALLKAVPDRHQLAYRLPLATGLRRDELRQLRWSDVKINAPSPCIQLRAETTKAKRADIVPLRVDLAKLLADAKADAGADDMQPVFRSLPSMASHKRYLAWAGIDFEDEQGRRADFHSLRHTFGSMLAKAGVAPRVAMSLMRHTDMRLTQNVYTDPRVFDLAGAVAKLPTMGADAPTLTIRATGTDPRALAQTPSEHPPESMRSKMRSTTPAVLGYCKAVIGNPHQNSGGNVNRVSDSNWHQKTPSGEGVENERVKGVEPSTFTLAT